MNFGRSCASKVRQGSLAKASAAASTLSNHNSPTPSQAASAGVQLCTLPKRSPRIPGSLFTMSACGRNIATYQAAFLFGFGVGPFPGGLLATAYGLAAPNRTIVTKEVSAPSKKRANRKVPDVCNSFGQVWIKDFDLYRTLGFKA